MAGSTPIYGFPYPESSDLVANYPALGQDLAEDIESTISGLPAAGVQLITSQAFSAVASVSVNNCFSATFDNYRIAFDHVGSGGAQNMQIRMRVSGSDNTTSNYYYQLLEGSGATVTSFRNAAAASFIVIGVVINTLSYGHIDLFNPFKASATAMTSLNGYNITTPTVSSWAATHNVASSFDGFTVYPASGTFTGTLRVYGYKNS